MNHRIKLAVLALLATTVFASCRKETTYYTVTFDANGGQLSGETVVTVAEGKPIPSPHTNAVREGYWLRGWYMEAEAVNEFNIYYDVVAHDMTLYAGWERLYTVKLHANGGVFLNDEGSEVWTINLSAGDLLWIPDNVARLGYVLEGWFKDAALTERWDFSTTITGEMELYAKWDEGIEGLSLENYPQVDGATSTRALNNMIACKLLGLPYIWSGISETNEYNVWPKADGDHGILGFPDVTLLEGHIACSQTYGAMKNLIDGKADIILRSTTASPDERAAAELKGVTLIETPIALDAFVFLKHTANPVHSLTLEQVRGIFTKKITDWSQVGGNKYPIIAYTRPRNSGSEEALRELVMNGQEPAEFPEEQQVWSMAGIFWEMERNPYGISYIFKNYKERIMHRYEPVFAIDGIFPTATAMKDRSYPLTTEIYAIVRSDLGTNSMAYKLYEWLQTGSAEMVLEECGFLPVDHP